MVPTVDSHLRTMAQYEQAIRIAIDTFLFSRIGAPLFHRYRVFDRLGSHPAFRGPYMSKLFTFLKESDTESIRRSHRRRAREIAVSMSKQTSENKNAPTDTTLSGRSAQQTVVSKITGRDAGLSLIPTAGGRPRSSASSMYRRSMEEDTVQALMDLSRDRPVDGPTSRDRPVDGPTLGVRPVDVLVYDPMPRERPVDGRTFEPRTRVKPVDGQTLRERPVDALVYKPTPRERPVGEKPYGPRPRERPVDDTKLKGRPVNVLAYEPTPKEWPVDDEAYEPMQEGRPVADPKLMGRPVDEKAYEPTPKEWPVDDEAGRWSNI